MRVASIVAIGLLTVGAGSLVSCGKELTPVETATGTLTATVSGLPTGTAAVVVVTGPDGFTQILDGSATLSQLVPGVYTLRASNIESAGHRYIPVPATQTMTITVGSTVLADVVYGLTTGAMDVAIAGLPQGVAANVRIQGPGFSQLLSETASLVGLPLGAYTVSASEVSNSGQRFGADPVALQLEILASVTPVAASVDYSQLTGDLRVEINGLPPGGNGDVTVSSSSGFSTVLSGTDSLVGLLAGTYSIEAVMIASDGSLYSPDAQTQDVEVAAGLVTTAAVAYAFAGSVTFNLTVDASYLTQSVQRYDGGVPLVAGRDALLRVFPHANEGNSESPDVRVILFDDVVPFDTIVIAAPAAAVPQTSNEALLGLSWNVMIPGSVIQPGLRLLVQVDPDDETAEQDDDDNFFPVDGVPLDLDVRALAPFAVQFVPVRHSGSGLQGNVTEDNADEFMDFTTRIWPAASYDVSVRAPYTTDQGDVQSNDGNGAWSGILSEIYTLRNVTDQSTRYYYGVVRATYGSGIAGLGYVPGNPNSSFKAAIGWDHLPSGSEVAAHEWGHNFGRLHAPCGNPSGVDPSYPYTNAQLGAWGFDLSTQSLMSPVNSRDVMSYCDPAWVSDYTYEAVLAFRQASANGIVVGAAVQATTSLVVWGRITQDSIILEPTFEIAAPPRLPDGAGPYRLEGLAADGASLFSLNFDGAVVADLPTLEKHFAFVIPVETARAGALAGLRVTGPGVRGASRSTSQVMAQPTVSPPFTASRTASGEMLLEWDRNTRSMVIVRDPTTGEILSFARSGATRVRVTRPDVQLIFSDGVRSDRSTIRLPF